MTLIMWPFVQPKMQTIHIFTCGFRLLDPTVYLCTFVFCAWWESLGKNLRVCSVPAYQIWDTKLSQMQTPLTLFALICNRQHVKMNFNFIFSFIHFKSAVAALISHPLKDKSHKILFCKCKELWVIHPFYY